jgi:hypothetical protein
MRMMGPASRQPAFGIMRELAATLNMWQRKGQSGPAQTGRAFSPG